MKGGAGERYADWSRFEKRRNTAMPAMAIALPITITITAMIGVFVTTATTNLPVNGGVAQWNPIVLMIAIQKETYTPISRCATFFAGLAILFSQTFVNLTQNTIPYGMDLAGMFPRYLSNKRASIILVILTCIAQPWRFLGQAAIFITILSCFSLYISTSTGILIADYWIVRKRMWKVPDLYNPEGIYWYTGGWNFRSIIAVVIGVVPGLPGFFYTVIDATNDNAAVKIFQIDYFVGFPLGFITYIALCHFFPPAGLGFKELMVESEEGEVDVIQGEGIDDKGVAVTEKQKGENDSV